MWPSNVTMTITVAPRTSRLILLANRIFLVVMIVTGCGSSTCLVKYIRWMSMNVECWVWRVWVVWGFTLDFSVSYGPLLYARQAQCNALHNPFFEWMCMWLLHETMYTAREIIEHATTYSTFKALRSSNNPLGSPEIELLPKILRINSRPTSSNGACTDSEFLSYQQLTNPCPSLTESPWVIHPWFRILDFTYNFVRLWSGLNTSALSITCIPADSKFLFPWTHHTATYASQSYSSVAMQRWNMSLVKGASCLEYVQWLERRQAYKCVRRQRL